MGFFDRFSSKCPELESILMRMDANISNNYKDAAQANLKEYIAAFEALCEAGKLNEKKKAHYASLLEDYKARMKKFTHKDQTPYWT